MIDRLSSFDDGNKIKHDVTSILSRWTDTMAGHKSGESVALFTGEERYAYI